MFKICGSTCLIHFCLSSGSFIQTFNLKEFPIEKKEARLKCFAFKRLNLNWQQIYSLKKDELFNCAHLNA